MRIRFRAFGIPVEIRPGLVLFATVMALLFRQASGAGPVRFFGVAFAIGFAVFWHELGHALVGRRLSLTPSMDLGFRIGGTRFGTPRTLLRRERVAMALAGPAMSLATALVAFAGRAFVSPNSQPDFALALDALALSHATVGIAHLVPVHPTDGSALIAELGDAFRAGRGRSIAMRVSIGCFVVLFATSLAAQRYLVAALAVFFAFRQRALLYTVDEQGEADAKLRARDRAYRALTRNDAASVVRHAEAAEREALDDAEHDEARYLLAWGHFLGNHPRDARAALGRVSPARARDFALEGAIAHDLGDHEASLQLFERALPRATRFVEPRMVHAILETRRFDEAAVLFADALGAKFSPAGVARVQRAAFDAGRDDACRDIGEALFRRTQDGSVAFLLACASSRLGRLEDALRWLGEARDRGLSSLDVLDREPALGPVRERPEWSALRSSFDLPRDEPRD